MKKFIKDGMVAVVIAPSFGAGWVTWNDNMPELMFHPDIVQMVLDGKRKYINSAWLAEHLGEEFGSIYCGSNIEDLEVRWLPIGTKFRVGEYDGAERIIICEEEKWYEA